MYLTVDQRPARPLPHGLRPRPRQRSSPCRCSRSAIPVISAAAAAVVDRRAAHGRAGGRHGGGARRPRRWCRLSTARRSPSCVEADLDAIGTPAQPLSRVRPARARRAVGDHLLVPAGAGLRGAGQGVVVDVHDPEAVAVALGPLEVVEQRPHEEAPQVDAVVERRARRPAGGRRARRPARRRAPRRRRRGRRRRPRRPRGRRAAAGRSSSVTATQRLAQAVGLDRPATVGHRARRGDQLDVGGARPLRGRAARPRRRARGGRGGAGSS